MRSNYHNIKLPPIKWIIEENELYDPLFKYRYEGMVSHMIMENISLKNLISQLDSSFKEIIAGNRIPNELKLRQCIERVSLGLPMNPPEVSFMEGKYLFIVEDGIHRFITALLIRKDSVMPALVPIKDLKYINLLINQ